MTAKKQPDGLQVGAVAFDLMPGTAGPSITLEGDYLHSFAWFVSSAAHVDESVDDEKAMLDAVVSGEVWYHQIMEFRQLQEGDDLEAAQRDWKELTGLALEGELRAVQVGSSATDIVPLSMLQETVQKLRAMHYEYRIDPPWLFLEKSRWMHFHKSEVALMQDLNRRVSLGEVKQEEFIQFGMVSTEYGREKIKGLIGFQAPLLAKLYYAFLSSEMPDLISPPPWLFCREPSWDIPHPDEQIAIVALNKEARAIDDAEQALGGDFDPPDLIEQRQALLIKMQEHGLLDAKDFDSHLHWLHKLQADALRSRLEAADKARAYLSSPARQKYNPDASETDILKAPICMDIFRGLILPDNVTLNQWVSWGEHLLRRHGPAQDVQADQGDFPYHDQDGLVTIIWRKDMGFPALRYISLAP